MQIRLNKRRFFHVENDVSCRSRFVDDGGEAETYRQLPQVISINHSDFIEMKVKRWELCKSYFYKISFSDPDLDSQQDL